MDARVISRATSIGIIVGGDAATGYARTLHAHLENL